MKKDKQIFKSENNVHIYFFLYANSLHRLKHCNANKIIFTQAIVFSYLDLSLIHPTSIIAIMLLHLVLCYILSNFIGSSNSARQNNILTRGLFTRHHGLNRPVNASLKVVENGWFWQIKDHFHEPNDEPNWQQRYWQRYKPETFTILHIFIEYCTSKIGLWVWF